MSSPKQQHEIDRFQIERLILFSDAVFAIAITLLVIEIKVPHFDKFPSNQELVDAMQGEIPIWVGFFISFFVVGAFWAAHHRIFQYIDHQSSRLVFLNLLFLLTIVIMPFTSAFYSEYFQRNFPFRLYCLDVMAAGIMQLILWRYISHEKGIITHRVSKQERQYETVRSSVVATVFFIAFFLSYCIDWFQSLTFFWLSRTSFSLIFVFYFFINRKYKKTGN